MYLYSVHRVPPDLYTLWLPEMLTGRSQGKDAQDRINHLASKAAV